MLQRQGAGSAARARLYLLISLAFLGAGCTHGLLRLAASLATSRASRPRVRHRQQTRARPLPAGHLHGACMLFVLGLALFSYAVALTVAGRRFG